MTYISDGQAYSYMPKLRQSDVRPVAIGWLDDRHPYREGPVDPDFLRVLDEASRTPSLHTFGLHYCELCLATGSKPASESTELIVVAPDGTWYVAPTMIIHYVTEHAYSPPDEFVAAVLSGRFLDSEEVGGYLALGE